MNSIKELDELGRKGKGDGRAILTEEVCKGNVHIQLYVSLSRGRSINIQRHGVVSNGVQLITEVIEEARKQITYDVDSEELSELRRRVNQAVDILQPCSI